MTPDLDTFLAVVAPDDPPLAHAERVEQGVPVYQAAALTAGAGDQDAVAAEWAEVLAEGAGIIVIEGP